MLPVFKTFCDVFNISIWTGPVSVAASGLRGSL